MQITPTVIKSLLHYVDVEFVKPESLKFIGSASAPHPEELVKHFEDTFGLPLAVGYGMTEATCGICLNLTIPRTNYSVGRPIDAMSLEIIHEGKAVAVGEQGEVAISGDNLMKGYVNVADGESIRIEDGRLFTGDLGYVDEEGFLYIVGRNNDIVKRGDYRLNLLEVEKALGESGSVREVCVIDVPHPLLGTDLIAFIVRAGSDAKTSREWLRTFKPLLESKKLPSEFLEIDEIPKFGALKTNRRALKEQYAELKAQRKTKTKTTSKSGE